MNNKIKNKWLKALRSGKYKQGRNYLCRVDDDGDDSFCCLGVLCELHAEETKGVWREGNYLDVLYYKGNEVLLPEEVIKWAELEDDDPFLGVNNNRNRYPASELNDGGKTFKQIANLIEKYL